MSSARTDNDLGTKLEQNRDKLASMQIGAASFLTITHPLIDLTLKGHTCGLKTASPQYRRSIVLNEF